MLLLFVRQANKAIMRKDKKSVVWENRGIQVDDSSIIQSVVNLRRNLRNSSRKPRFISTIPKLGYKFIAPVERLHQRIS
ncbi:winged helix-turn-helix domain-containing protein [Vibrio splendidus]|uniref:winged helix-turn-helix domain-containing protein n=1 Tax=Vibrio splendidus TaxID=29497 RepID=UPI000C85CD7A|nr:hypothetical protein CWO31_22715 [Vibrio splendidus]